MLNLIIADMNWKAQFDHVENHAFVIVLIE